MYEEIFDSYTMDLETFKAQLHARLSEFNENEDGYVYYIASDAWNYYLATAGAGNLGDALLPESMFHNLLSGKVSEIANLYDRCV